ncbi:MAG: hypothetical protein HRT53_10465 [Colwellia sp.]|nr:hypothetical protein [Colwellia sp.]
MTTDEFARLNALSEKALNETASRNELREFNDLLDDWNNCVEFNLINGLREF